MLHRLNEQEAKYIIDLLPSATAASIISNLDADTRRRFLDRNYDARNVAELLEYIDSDDAADILNEQPARFREEAIGYIEDETHAANILDLLRYDEQYAGAWMAKEMVTAHVSWTVRRCIDEIRRQAEEVERVYSVYVIDEKQKLLGRISLKKLILTYSDVKVGDIYEKDIISVEPHTDIEEVADMMQRYDLDAVPVANVQGRLLGRITIDDIVDLITEQAETDQQAMAGISEDTDYGDSVWQGARARLPWLLIGMIGGLLAARFARMYEHDIALLPAMAFFIPLITATGGNVGIQSSTVMVQSMDEYSAGSYVSQITKVLLIALINGIVIATCVFFFDWAVGNTFELSLVVSIALFCVVLLASIFGTITPLILSRFGINPAMASGPFITTANDLLGLAVYFSVARMLLSTI